MTLSVGSHSGDLGKGDEPPREAGVRSEMRKKVPHFKSESEERKFWATADSTRYIDWRRAQRTVLPDLRPSLRTISLRLPELMLAELKLLANKRDIPYQSLLKVFLAERIEAELRRPNGATRSHAAVRGAARQASRR